MQDNRARTNVTMVCLLILAIVDYSHAVGTSILEGVLLPMLPEATGPFANGTAGFVLGRMLDSFRVICSGPTSCPLRESEGVGRATH